MPPITSITRSTSSRATSASASVVNSAGSMPGRCRFEPADRDPDQLQRPADPGPQVVGLPDDQPGHLGADGAAAEQGDPQRLGGSTAGRASAGSRPRGPDRRRTPACGRHARHCHLNTLICACGSPPDAAGSGHSSPSGSGGNASLSPRRGRSRSSMVSRRSRVVQPSVADGDHRRARHVVVVAGHRAAVRPGGRHGEQVARGDVGRQELVPDQDVAALAVLAHHPGQHRPARRSGGRPGWRSTPRRTARCGCCRSSRRPRRRRAGWRPPSSCTGLTVPTR